MNPEDGRDIVAADSVLVAAERYVALEWDPGDDADRDVWVRPADDGEDIRVVVTIKTETTFSGRLSEEKDGGA